jgi:serine/threonine protein kinase
MLCGRLPFGGPNLMVDNPVDKAGTNEDTDVSPQKGLRVRMQRGDFVIDERLSPDAKELITSMLCADPMVRAKLEDIAEHGWLTSGAQWIVSEDGEYEEVVVQNTIIDELSDDEEEVQDYSMEYFAAAARSAREAVRKTSNGTCVL